MKQVAVISCLVVLAGRGPTPTQDSHASPPPLKQSSWTYQTTDDAMRKTRTWYASDAVVNPAQLGFPYEGGTTATIQLTQGLKDDPSNQQATLILHNGQIDCAGGCELNLKFDDGEVLYSTGTKGSCGDDECLNLPVSNDTDAFGTKSYKGFHKRLYASRRLTVEVPLYKYGRHQFEFDTAGLVWPQPGAPLTGDGTGLADGSKGI